jgi:hypothetical protein
MRFLLVFAFCFVSLFASAQIPMAVGGPQGIDVTRILARNWMSIPTYTDTPAAPLTGTPWPGRGYIIQVAKVGDTSVWQYTGVKWVKIGGFAENNYTYLESGGSYSTFPAVNVVLVRPATYYIQGTKYNSSSIVLIGFPKAANANGRIDAITLGTTGPGIIQGEESNKPSSPSIPANKLKIGFIYYAPFDTLAKVTGNELTSAFRIPGRDSIYFTSGDTTIAVKDSIGISRTDTASMLTNYVNTASNGLTKVGKDIRLGGTLNQQTRIALGGNGINIVGSADSSRFFGNGSVAVGYRANPGVYPDDSTYRFAVNGTSRLNGVVTYKGDLLPQNTPNAYTLGITQGSSFGAIRAYKNNGATSIQQIELGDNATGLNTAGTLSSPSAANYGFRVYGNNSAVDSGGGSYTNFRISPSINYSTNFKKAIHMGLSYEPTVSSLNNTTHIAFRNTRGSNLFNVNSGNTLIGYDTTSAAYQVDTTYKLDVNGAGRVNSILDFSQQIKISSNSNPVGGASTQQTLIAIGGDAARALSSSGGYGMIAIGRGAGSSMTTGGHQSTLIGLNAGNGITTGQRNTIIGSGEHSTFPSNLQSSIIITGGDGFENQRPDSALFGLNQRFAFIGGGRLSNEYINDFYLGAGSNVRSTHLSHLNLYAPSAFPTKADTIGSNFTINAGRGTGTGLGGSVIFRTSTPTTSGTTIQTLTERARISPSGNLLVGRTVDSIYKLDVNGNARISGPIHQMDIDPSSGFGRINLLMTNTGAHTSNRSILIGNGTIDNTTDLNIAIGSGVTSGAGGGNTVIGYASSATGGSISLGSQGQTSSATNGGVAIGPNATANGSVTLGQFSSSSGNSVSIGAGISSSVYGIGIGTSSSANNGGICIGISGSSNSNNAIAIGHRAKTTANNQLVFGGNDVSNGYGIRDIYFGSGVRNESKLSGIDYTINGSGAGDSSNRAGGSVTIAGGKGTGSGTPGDVIFSTTNTLSTPADSSTLQTLAPRVVVKGGTGNLLVGTTTDGTYKLDVNGDLSGIRVNTPKNSAYNGLQIKNASNETLLEVNGLGTTTIGYGSSNVTINGGTTQINTNGSSNARILTVNGSGFSSGLKFTGSYGTSNTLSIGAGVNTKQGIYYHPTNNFGIYKGDFEDTTSATFICTPNNNVLVGTTIDAPSSKLTVTSTTQGFLQPRMTNTQRNAIPSTEQGLQVFSTTDSANYVYRGTGGGWQKIANEISGSATLDFPSTGHGNSADLTFTVTGASEGDVVALGIPNASIVANASFTAWVSATDTVKVRFNNYASSGSSDPALGTFKIKVFK